MKKLYLSTALAIGLLGLLGTASIGYAQISSASVEYVKICSLYGPGFHYIPGTDICTNDFNGDTRQATAGGVWRSLLPYPEGKWVTNQQQECTPGGKLMTVGAF